MVNVKALIDSIGRISWRNGNTAGNVTHEIDADGTHRIIVTIPKHIVEWDPPKSGTPTVFRGFLGGWEDIKPPPRTPTKKG